MDRCQRCGSPRIHVSRLRSPLEHARAALTGHVPVRCHACNHRAWTPDPPVTIRPKTGDLVADDRAAEPHGAVRPEDLDSLDPVP